MQKLCSELVSLRLMEFTGMGNICGKYNFHTWGLLNAVISLAQAGEVINS
jgi:hypothetical protein